MGITTYKTKMLGLVTLYKPNLQQAIDNISLYIDDIDRLIVWNNSPNDEDIKDCMMAGLSQSQTKIIWYGTGSNRCIAPAINAAWQYGQDNSYDMLLIMDQDSRWSDFPNYRKQIDDFWEKGNKWVFTPYFANSGVPNDKPVQFLRIFINSGTVIPIKILSHIGGADERMPLDALDHDLAIRIKKAGFRIVCLTSVELHHTIGQPTTSGILHLKTSNYNAWRTYSIARSHAINYRKHRDWLNFQEKKRIIKEYYVRRLLLILLNEDDKWNRIKMLIKGTYDGLTLPLDKQ